MKSLSMSEFSVALESLGSGSVVTGTESDMRFADGLSIHRNNAQLARISSLRQTFPVVEKLVGEQYFGALAAEFVAKHPPRSAALHEYGGDMPAFIQTFPPLVQWSYLADVARLEWARLRAFHAADEQPVNLSGDDLVSDLEGALSQLLRWHSSVCLVQSEHPAFSIWNNHESQTRPADIEDWRHENVLVWREGLRLRTEAIDDLSCELLASVSAGIKLENFVSGLGGKQEEIVISLATLLKWKVFCC